MNNQHPNSTDENSPSKLGRREFLTASAGAVAAALLAAGSNSLFAESSDDGMIYRTLGRTGERVSIIGLGGWHIGQPSISEHESIQLIRQAIDRGITFMDNCWDYNEGASEVRMGQALKDGYRQKVFLMDKIDGRTKPEAARQIDTCLQRLQTDRIDLMQFHEVIRLEDPDRIFAEGGAVEAMVEAQKAGKVRLIGFTGHKDPSVHLRTAGSLSHMSAVEIALRKVRKLSARQARELLSWLDARQANGTTLNRPPRKSRRNSTARLSMQRLKAWHNSVRGTTDWQPPRMPDDLVKVAGP